MFIAASIYLQFAGRVKKIVLKASEPKACRYVYTILGSQKITLKHSTIQTFSLNGSVTLPSQGTGDINRVGDQINMIGLQLKMLVGQNTDRPNVSFKYWVVKAPEGSRYAYSSWFIPTTNNVMLDDINNDFIKVISSGVWHQYTGDLTNGTDEFTFVKKLWIPYKKVLKFGPQDAASTHNDDDVFHDCTL